MAAAASAQDDPDHSQAAHEVNQAGKQTLNDIGTTEDDMMKNNNTDGSSAAETVKNTGADAIRKTGDFIDGLR